MGVQFAANIDSNRLDLAALRIATQCFGHTLEILRFQHVALGEGELENRICRYVVPVNQFVNHILVDTKRQNIGHYMHFETLLFREPLQRPDFVQLPLGIYLEPSILSQCFMTRSHYFL